MNDLLTEGENVVRAAEASLRELSPLEAEQPGTRNLRRFHVGRGVAKAIPTPSPGRGKRH